MSENKSLYPASIFNEELLEFIQAAIHEARLWPEGSAEACDGARLERGGLTPFDAWRAADAILGRPNWGDRV